jgi:uncharacterized damage-inducible protein DinB
LDTKQFLLKQLRDAYVGDEEMSLHASLGNLSQEEASWRMNETTWTIEEIVYHIAACEIEYCRQGFGVGLAHDRPVGDIAAGLKLLDRAHAHLVSCLEALPEEALDEPIPTQWHGESSAAHFFWIMIMHRVSHAAQIRTIRRAYGSRTHYLSSFGLYWAMRSHP